MAKEPLVTGREEEKDELSERQKDLYLQLGKDARQNIDKQKKHGYLISVILGCVIVIAGVLFIILGKGQYLMEGTILCFMALGAMAFGIGRASQEATKKKGLSDYQLGRMAAGYDPRIKGNSRKAFQAFRLSGIVFTVLLGLFGTAVMLMSSVFSHPVDFASLSEKTGVFASAHYNSTRSDSNITITLDGDTAEYRIGSLYMDAFNWDDFTSRAQKGQNITLKFDPNASSSQFSTYYVEQNGYVFLSQEEVSQAEQANNRIGQIMAWVFYGGALLCLASIPISYITYKKNESSETISLACTPAESKEIYAKAAESNQAVPDALTLKASSRAPKKIRIIFAAVVLLIAAACFIIGFTAAGNLLQLEIGLPISIFFFLIFLLSALDLSFDYIEVSEGQLILHRFWRRARVFRLSEIKEIKINTNIYISGFPSASFYGRDGKKLFSETMKSVTFTGLLQVLRGQGTIID
jgi:hypothetical protein